MISQPQFDDAKSQKAWERTRVLAIQNAPDVSYKYLSANKFGCHNFSHKFRKFLAYNNFSHIFIIYINLLSLAIEFLIV